MDEPVRIGRYQVQKVLGKGAMGVVYLAFDPQIGRPVALKTVRPTEGARPEEVAESQARFLREARAAGKLLHPNIVTLFDVFEERGTLYIAMEYLEGVPLDHFCSRSHLLPIEQGVQLSAQALSALDYAHRAGIVHRDIKPGNLMVVDGQTLKVMDFGLARDSGASLTHSGTVIGTPHYMSPEQIQGLDLDGRADLFAMGVVLYEVVTGERPFEGDTIPTVIYRVLHEEPPPARAVNPRVPEPLSLAIRKALSKRPEDRFPTAAAFRDALLHPQEPDPLQTWMSLERPGEPAPSVPATHDAPFLPPIPAGQRGAQRHTLSRKYTRFAVLALLIAAGGYIGISRYADYSGGKAAIAPPPSQEILPVALEVTTTPPGAALFLDGVAVDVVTLAPNDARSHVVEARLGCLSARSRVTGVSTKAKLQMTLQAGPYEFAVTSDPPGAKVSLDGTETGLATPARIPRQDCQPFSVGLSLPGYDPSEFSVDPSKQAGVQAVLTAVASHGSLKVHYPSGILQVFEGDRLLGTSGQVLSLPAGDHTLRLVDQRLRGVREEAVKVTSGADGVLKVSAFSTGQVFLYGKPANDGRVMVDGTRFEDLPLNGTASLAVGPHQFLVVSPEGRRVGFSWSIKPGEQTRVVDFASGRVETP